MKKIYLSLVILAGTLSSVNAQLVEDSVSMSPFYSNQVFYSMADGEVANIVNNDWDLGFSCYGNGAAGSAIILNEANTTLWAYPGDTASWSTLDTTNHASWEQLLNTDTSWTNGAFNRYRGANGTFDMGWGILNPQNNYWTFGDSLYVAKLSTGAYKKIWITSLKSGVWDFKYADLDGSNEQMVTITKSNYPNKNFVYHSMVNEQTIDREPTNTSWDIMFMKHVDIIPFAGAINVTSVFNNREVWSALSEEADYNAAIASTTPQTNFNQKIDNIGRSWKKFNSSIGWTVYDSTAYFLYNNDSTGFYRLVFTDFGGMSTGKAYFSKELLVTTNVQEQDFEMNYTIYPNPAVNQVTLLLDYPTNETVAVSLINLSGQVVLQQSIGMHAGINQKQLFLNDLPKGVYVLNLSNTSFNSSRKLIIE